jgi:single-strand selective monofunctional uracil DNA glycosylase
LAAEFKDLQRLFSHLEKVLSHLEFAPPVSHVYNPLVYAKDPFEQYLRRFVVGPPGRTLLLGMNPGPWGMAQTGVPFGEVAAVRDWLGLSGQVGQPALPHKARPIEGFDCRRSEVSGRRLWGLFANRYRNATEFSRDFVVINYCPLVFMEDSGRNRTPDKLPRSERTPLYQACDHALHRLLELLQVRRAVGVGKFALERLQTVTKADGSELPLDSILHPSPANPQANADWEGKVLPVLDPTFTRA